MSHRCNVRSLRPHLAAAFGMLFSLSSAGQPDHAPPETLRRARLLDARLVPSVDFWGSASARSLSLSVPCAFCATEPSVKTAVAASVDPGPAGLCRNTRIHAGYSAATLGTSTVGFLLSYQARLCAFWMGGDPGMRSPVRDKAHLKCMMVRLHPSRRPCPWGSP